MKPGEGVQWADFPTDVDEIKKHLNLRRQAMRIMLAEIAALNQSLQSRIGPAEWLLFQAEQKAAFDEMGQQKENGGSAGDN